MTHSCREWHVVVRVISIYTSVVALFFASTASFLIPFLAYVCSANMNKPVFHVPVIVLAPVSTAVPGIQLMMSTCRFYTAWKRLATGSDWHWLPVALSVSSKCPATCWVPHLHQWIDGGKEEGHNASHCWSGLGQEAWILFTFHFKLTTTSSVCSCLNSLHYIQNKHQINN